MAINPLLLNVKPISEITTVNNPIEGHLLFYDGSDELKKVDIVEFQSLIGGIAKPLAITDASPTVSGWYKPTTAGTYANAGGLVAQAGYDTLFYFNGTTWSKVEVELPQPIVNNYTNNNTYNLDPEQIVPSEALYTDDTLAGDIIKRVDINTGENVNYREITTWHDGSVMDDSKVDGVVFIKKGTKYYKRSNAFNLNVRHFGAKGDTDKNDNGTDDTEALQKAINAAHDLYNFKVLTAGNRLGSTTVYLPAGRYRISSPLILKEGVIIKGESRASTNIHCTNPQIAITNVTGYESNGDIISSKNNRIENLTLSQGGIELIQPWHTTVKNIFVLNLFGQYNVGLEIQIPVNVSIENFRVFNSNGTGIIYKDYAGVGPSTTCFFKRVYVSQCNIGFEIDGNTGESHAIYSSSFEDIVSEYNTVGMILRNNIQHCRFVNLHLEQNTRSMEIHGSVIAYISDVFDDTEFGIGFYGNSENANITISNVNSNLQIHEGWSGTLNLLGHYRLPGFPSSAKINKPNIQRFLSSSVINKHDAGSMIYFEDRSIPAWFDGGSWRSADGFNGKIKRRGQTSERPAPNTVDTGFSFYDFDLKKMLYADNTANVWRDAMGNTV